MKIILKNIYTFLCDFASVIEYLWNWIFLYVFLRNHYSPFPLMRNKNRVKTLCVFANGPSLKDALARVLVDEEFKDVDFSVMNYFANDSLYTQVKPQIYCLWDPMFYCKDDRYNEVMELFGNMNKKTEWDMTLFIRGRVSDFLAYSHLNNPKIHIHSISAPRINASRPVKNFFYKHGWAMPYTWTVANVNMFTAVQLGYSTVRLYGADMTLFQGICVNKNNELCRIVSHFYENKNENELKPVYDHKLKKTQRLASFVSQVLHMIEGHDDIAEYAESVGVKCLNCCEHSMLDCYQKVVK